MRFIHAQKTCVILDPQKKTVRVIGISDAFIEKLGLLLSLQSVTMTSCCTNCLDIEHSVS